MGGHRTAICTWSPGWQGASGETDLSVGFFFEEEMCSIVVSVFVAVGVLVTIVYHILELIRFSYPSPTPFQTVIIDSPVYTIYRRKKLVAETD